MSVYKKLQEARVLLQKKELKKSGHNKFAGYQYFELSDFLPAIQDIFNGVGLCGVVSYSREEARIDIFEVDGGGKITITSPMAEANLKGSHPIQCLGAVETYQRRYLWMTAMEIVEHDAIDSATQVEEKSRPSVSSERAVLPEKLALIEEINRLSGFATKGHTRDQKIKFCQDMLRCPKSPSDLGKKGMEELKEIAANIKIILEVEDEK